MAIFITEDGKVYYENVPEEKRALFPNVQYGASYDDIYEAVAEWLEDHPEATTTVEDGSITPVKLDSENEATADYVLGYDGEKFVWVDVNTYLADLEERKADKNGNYPDMVVGSADQLLSSVKINDKIPYLFRTSGGSVDIGDREYDEIVGGSVVWNQYLSNTVLPSDSALFSENTYTNNNVTFTKNANGGYTISTTSEGATALTEIKISNKSLLPPFGTGNVCFIALNGKTEDIYLNWGGANHKNLPQLYKRTDSTGFNYWLRVSEGAIITDPIDVYPLVIDITAMLGSTIANYIYNLETTTQGSGIAKLKSWGFFTEDFYEYSMPTIKSVEGLTSHDMVGFNQFNSETGTLMVIGGMQYQITGTYTALSLDGTTITPDSNGKFTPTNNGTLTVTGGNATDTCVHFVWDGEKDDTYEPYKTWSYPLDDSLTLRGLPELDENNSLYYDGDVYESDGTVTRKYYEVDLGTLEWTTRYTGDTNIAYYSVLPKSYNRQVVINGISDRYTIIGNVTDGSYLSNPDSLSVGIYSYRQVTAGATTAIYIVVPKNEAISGNLLYELSSTASASITETAEPYQTPQIVDDWGTEKYVTTSIIPVGHNTDYTANLRAKLEMSPNSPDSDGDYIVRHDNGTNSYVPLVVPEELPDSPTTDGTYSLKCTVTNGEAALSWVADENE